jgi:hypothetical protein
MPALINELISPRDNVQIIRDQIAAILKLELSRQGELGLAVVPRVFIERSRPWGALVESPPNFAPIVNVWFDNASFDGPASNISERQRCDATFNVDAYGFAPSREDGPGHKPADEAAALAVQDALGLCRKILMSAHYTYLALRGLVWKRWPQTIGIFQPPIDQRMTHHVVAGRLALAVQFNEFSPQVAGEVLETLSVEVKRAETGEVYLLAEYPSP